MGDCTCEMDTSGGKGNNLLALLKRREARSRDLAAGLLDHINSPRQNTTGTQKLLFTAKLQKTMQNNYADASENS